MSAHIKQNAGKFEPKSKDPMLISLIIVFGTIFFLYLKPFFKPFFTDLSFKTQNALRQLLQFITLVF